MTEYGKVSVACMPLFMLRAVFTLVLHISMAGLPSLRSKRYSLAAKFNFRRTRHFSYLANSFSAALFR